MMGCKLPENKQPTPFAQFICNMTNKQYINENMDQIIMNRLIHEFIRRNDMTMFNAW